MMLISVTIGLMLVGIIFLCSLLQNRYNKPHKIPFTELMRFEGNVVSLADWRAKKDRVAARQQKFQGYGHSV